MLFEGVRLCIVIILVSGWMFPSWLCLSEYKQELIQCLAFVMVFTWCLRSGLKAVSACVAILTRGIQMRYRPDSTANPGLRFDAPDMESVSLTALFCGGASQ